MKRNFCGNVIGNQPETQDRALLAFTLQALPDILAPEGGEDRDRALVAFTLQAMPDILAPGRGEALRRKNIY